MTNENDFMDDSLDDMLGNAGPARPIVNRAPADYKPAAERAFTEPCPKCRGRGKFVSYSGRVLGDCFTCKGSGKQTFKSSASDRAKGRQHAADRKVKTQANNMADFIAAYPAEHEWLTTTAPRWEVAANFLEVVTKYGSLTEKQLAVVHSGMARDAARAAQRVDRVANAPSVDVSKLETAFATARAKAERVGQLGVWMKPIALQSEKTTVLFSPGSIGSKWEGMIFAKTADGKKLGHVASGKFVRRFECTEVEATAVLDCASDPHKAAVAYGKAWSCCGICGKTLTNDASIARGIGPVCAGRYGW